MLEDKTQEWINKVKKNPLTAVGVVAGVGIFIAYGWRKQLWRKLYPVVTKEMAAISPIVLGYLSEKLSKKNVN